MDLRSRDARFVGLAFLFYIVVTMTSTIMFDGVLRPGGITQQLGHLTRMIGRARVTVVLDPLQVVCALVLAVPFSGSRMRALNTRHADDDVPRR